MNTHTQWRELVVRYAKKKKQKRKKKYDMSSKHGVSWIMQKTSPILQQIHIIVQELRRGDPMLRIQIGQTERREIRG